MKRAFYLLVSATCFIILATQLEFITQLANSFYQWLPVGFYIK